MNKTVFKADASFMGFSKKYYPNIRFQIPSELRTGTYLTWLRELFADFIISLSDTNEMAAEKFRQDHFESVGEEDGIGGIQLDGMYFEHSKLHAYDGESRRNVSDWKGIVFHDHFDKRSQVKPIYLLSEKFELFLQQRNISYQRFGCLINGEHEEQVTQLSEADQESLNTTFGELCALASGLNLRAGMDSYELFTYPSLSEILIRHLVRYMSFEEFMKKYPELNSEAVRIKKMLQDKAINWE